MQHARHIVDLSIKGSDKLPETDKQNLVELTSQLIEAQEGTNMKRLELTGLSRSSVDEPSEEDKHLINALLNSGFTQLTTFRLNGNASWFGNSEIRTHLFSFIQD